MVGGEGAAAALAGGGVAAGPAARVGWLGARVRRRRRGAALEVEELGGDRHARGRGRGVSAREGRREAAANCYSPTHFSPLFMAAFGYYSKFFAHVFRKKNLICMEY